MAIQLDDLLDEKNIDLELRARTPESALRKLVELLAASDQVGEPEIFLEQVLAREARSPTLIENDVAFPHARTDLVDKIVLAIGRSHSGIPFGEKGDRARLFFLIGVPQRLVNDYLVVVGALARLVHDDETRARLLYADTKEEFLAALRTAP